MASKSVFLAILKGDHAGAGEIYLREGRTDKAAAMFVKAGEHARAAPLFQEIGDLENAVVSFMKAGHYQKAGDLLVRDEQHQRAIGLFDKGKEYWKAAQSCLALKQPGKAARFFERANALTEAAKSYEAAGELEKALLIWEQEAEDMKSQSLSSNDMSRERAKKNVDVHRAQLLAKVGRYKEAADLLVLHRMGEQAGKLLEKHGEFDGAAAAYLHANLSKDALRILDKTTKLDPGIKAKIYLRAGRNQEAGEMFEQSGLFEEAANAFESARNWNQAGFFWLKAGDPERAADFYFRDDNFAEAAKCFLSAKRFKMAGETFLKADDSPSAAECFLQSGDQLRAATLFAENGKPEAASAALQAVPTKSPDFPRASLQLIPLLLQDGLGEGAMHRLQMIPAQAAGVPPEERQYWEARIHEATGNRKAALAGFQKVMAIKRDYLDVTQRFSALSQAADSAPQSAGKPGKSLNGGGAPDNSPYELTSSLAALSPRVALYQARDNRSQKQILIQTMEVPGDPTQNQDAVKALKNLDQLNHPAILGVVDVVVSGNRILVCSEDFKGRPLTNLGMPLPSSRGLGVVRQVAEALSSAHRMGLSHGALTPHTVLVSDEDKVKVAGFGLASPVDQEADGEKTVDMRYISPEGRQGKPAGIPGDLYSLAVLSCLVLTGKAPASKEEAVNLPWAENQVPDKIKESLLNTLSVDPGIRPAAHSIAQAIGDEGFVTGQVINKRYQIVDVLGQGGMGKVYRAKDLELNETVAIKTLLSGSNQQGEEERLMREVQICRKITHPNVVRVYDMGRFPGGIFVSMEVLEGSDLRKILDRQGKFPLVNTRAILQQVSAGLSEAHQLGVVHRDLKPANIVISGSRAKIMDFGIARTEEANVNLTQTGQVLGSPKYMSPEQIQGKPLDGRSDLYSLGIIAYTLITGEEPFQGQTPMAIVLQHIQAAPPDPTALRPDLPSPWRDFIARLLSKDPAARYQDAYKVQEALATLPTK